MFAATACGGDKQAGSTPDSTASTSGIDLNGAGATFPYPIYSKWFLDYAAETGVRINYQSAGSGAGIQQLSSGTVDLGRRTDPCPTTSVTPPAYVLHFPVLAQWSSPQPVRPSPLKVTPN